MSTAPESKPFSWEYERKAEAAEQRIKELETAYRTLLEFTRIKAREYGFEGTLRTALAGGQPKEDRSAGEEAET